jgi:hypothetical protein
MRLKSVDMYLQYVCTQCNHIYLKILYIRGTS